jgi:Mrp family chromosome partitioning ATPase
MERLHAAIEKARRQRQSAPIERVSAARAEAFGAESLSKAWAALHRLDVPAGQVRKSRLVAYEGGTDAGPYDLLRTRILQQAQKNDWRRVAVVSPHSECGKTTTVANLAFSFGRQKDLRTLALDFDLRRVGLARVLGQQCRYTMADVLERRVPFSEHGLLHGTNVAIGLNAGPVRNPSEVLQNQQTRDVLDEIEEAYQPDIVLFDMPPLMSSDDNFGFLKNVDCALILAEADRTTTAQIDLAERQVSELTNVMGVVLNKCRYATEGYGYDYGSA